MEGARLRLYCDGVGRPAPSFQWYKNNAPIEGATFRELTRHSVSTEDQGEYFCKVYNSTGEISSELIQVTIVPPSTGEISSELIQVTTVRPRGSVASPDTERSRYHLSVMLFGKKLLGSVEKELKITLLLPRVPKIKI